MRTGQGTAKFRSVHCKIGVEMLGDQHLYTYIYNHKYYNIILYVGVELLGDLPPVYIQCIYNYKYYYMII